MAPTRIPSVKEIVPRYDIHEFPQEQGGLKKLLDIVYPPLTSPDFDQLDFVGRHVRNYKPEGCKSVVIEEHYIDRSFMADYCAFYASSIKQYPNWCRRVHFFSLDKLTLEEKIEELLEKGRITGESANKVSERIKEGEITA